MKYIVGINLPMRSRCHESGVALIDMEGNVLFAANEERYSRKKLDGDFPEKAISAMFAHTGISPRDVAIVAVPTLPTFTKAMRFMKFLIRERRSYFMRPGTYKTLLRLFFKHSRKPEIGVGTNQEQEKFVMRFFWKDFISQKFPNASLSFVDHHVAHASGAYFTSPWENSLIVTLDGAGNLRSSIVAEGTAGKIKIIDSSFVPHSLGTFWGSVTKVCGFKSGIRHGGKVTGLAASGDPGKLLEKMRALVGVSGARVMLRGDTFFDPKKLVPDWASYEPERLRAYLGDATREDVAAAAQKRLEEVVTGIVGAARKKIPHRNIVLAGGVCANVLVNQKILEMDEIDDIYIFPAMSDGGLALGAALFTLSQKTKLIPKRFVTPYLGSQFTTDQIEDSLKKLGVNYNRMENPAEEVAGLIDTNKVVAFFQGRMEYGPRALGNRSILYSPRDPAVNDWLNEKLNRSEFMPFAPVTLIEKASQQYIGIARDPIAGTYMTVTYQCTDKMKREAPACVHLDGTARPQIIRRNDNPYYYDVVAEYEKLSGIPTVINTSFNMHEEPIVCSPDDALRAFFSAGLDALVLENFLVLQSANKDIQV